MFPGSLKSALGFPPLLPFLFRRDSAEIMAHRREDRPSAWIVVHLLVDAKNSFAIFSAHRLRAKFSDVC